MINNDAYGYNGLRFINEIFAENNLTAIEMIEYDMITREIYGNLNNYSRKNRTRIVLVEALFIYAYISDFMQFYDNSYTLFAFDTI